MKIAIVAPVHVPVSKEWMEALEKQKEYADVIIVDDSEDGLSEVYDRFDCYSHELQWREMGDSLYGLFEQFHRSAACKQFGLWLAWKRGYDIVIVIDSDCVVPRDFVSDHMYYVMQRGDIWSNPLRPMLLYPRGYPYHMRSRKRWAHMGMWSGEFDMYGADRIGKQIPRELIGVLNSNDASFFPLSGMNVSFVREAIPYMLFLPNFRIGNELVTRHDDIWGGYILQKIARMKEKSLSYGRPFVYHDTVVNADEDAAAEAPMIKHEKEFYEFIDDTLVSDMKEPWTELFHPARQGTFDGLAPAFEFQSKAFA